MTNLLSPEQIQALVTGRHVAVLANAGSGKTRVLTLRYLWLVLNSPLTVEEIVKKIVAITFTTKAAAEMRERIHGLVEALLASEEMRRDLEIDLSDERIVQRLTTLRGILGNSRISTFHSFCAGLLRLYGHEIDVDPESREISDRDAKMMITNAIRRSIREVLESRAEELYAMYLDIDITGVEDAVEFFVRRPEDLIREKQWFESFATTDDIVAARQGRAYELIASVALDGLRDARADIKEKCKPKNADEQQNLADVLKAIDACIDGSMDAWKGLPDLLNYVYTKAGTGRKTQARVGGTRELDQVPSGVWSAVNVLASQADVEAEHRQVRYLRLILDLAWTARTYYQSEKRELRMIDFDDMMGLCVKLMDERKDLARIIRSGITYLMVDEFQDTNPLQYDLVCHLVPDLRDANAARASELFIVGDDKQSIYGFRGADVRLFRKAVQDIGNEAVTIPTSYRMAPPLANHVNTICAPIFEQAVDQTIPYSPLKAGRTKFADDAGTLSVLITPPSEDPDDDRKHRELEMSHVVARISALLSTTRPGDIAILSRSVAGVSIASHLLHAAGIPFQAHGGREFFSRPEVADVRNLLRLCADGGDAVACAATLRSPLFGLTDTEIFEVLSSTEENRLSLTALAAAAQRHIDNASIVRADLLLRQLSDAMVQMPLPLFIRHALDVTNWHATLVGDPRREQAIANVDKLIDIVRAEIQRPGSTLRDVIDRISVPDEEDREAEGRFEAEENAVHVMTIHAAKGLEFPVVFITDISGGGGNGTIMMSEHLGATIALADKVIDASGAKVERPRGLTHAANAMLLKENDRDENRRLLYVALTRAEDHVYLSLTKPVLKSGATGATKGIADLLRTIVFESECPFPILNSTDDIEGGLFEREEPVMLDRTMVIEAPTSPDTISASGLAVLPDDVAATMTSRFSSAEAMLLGTAVHDALAAMLDANVRDGRTDEDIIAAFAPTSTTMRSVYAEHIRNVMTSDLWTRLNTMDLLVERDFVGLDGETLVTGRIDVAGFISDDHLHIWDWKTNDISSPEHARLLNDVYRPQLDIYIWLVKQRYPNLRTVTASLVFTALPVTE